MIERWQNVEVLLKNGAKTKIPNQSDEDIWEYLKYMEAHESLQKLEALTLQVGTEE